MPKLKRKRAVKSLTHTNEVKGEAGCIFDATRCRVGLGERADMGEQHCGERSDRKSGLVR
jgi:hypothetical protein